MNYKDIDWNESPTVQYRMTVTTDRNDKLERVVVIRLVHENLTSENGWQQYLLQPDGHWKPFMPMDRYGERLRPTYEHG